jgi:hypothetical protein
MFDRRRHRIGCAAAAALVTSLVFAAGAADAAPRIGMVCTNGPTFDLVARGGTIETPDGNAVFMWSYGKAGGDFQLMGPVMCVNQGDTVTVRLHNSLPESTSIIFPGQRSVSSSGGAPGLLASQAASGGDVTYTFTAGQPGTYLYESGSDPAKQVEMGLYGALVVRPTGHPDQVYGDASTKFDPTREFLFVFNEIDPELHRAVELGLAFDRTKLHNRYFTINGRSFPDTIQDNDVAWFPHQPYGALVRVKPYNAGTNNLPALIRMVNAGLLNHPFHPHGNHLRQIAQDGRLFSTPATGDVSTEHFAETIPSGATEDWLFKWTDQDSFSPQNPLPVAIPSYRNLMFKNGNTFYSGSPYLGYKGTLPTGTVSQNVCGESYFPWHSHALNEFTNFDEGFGGMATLLRVDPLGGCIASPIATNIQLGTLRGGGYANLAEDDTARYEVNATTTTPRRTDWYATFSGIPAGLQNLKLTYKGRNSVACTQTLSVYRWSTSSYVQLDSRSVGTTDTLIADIPVSSSSDYVGTGSTYRGQVRVRVACQGPTVAFFSSGNLMKLVYDAP